MIGRADLGDVVAVAVVRDSDLSPVPADRAATATTAAQVWGASWVVGLLLLGFLLATVAGVRTRPDGRGGVVLGGARRPHPLATAVSDGPRHHVPVGRSVLGIDAAVVEVPDVPSTCLNDTAPRRGAPVEGSLSGPPFLSDPLATFLS